MTNNFEIGDIVLSKAGRDCGKVYIISQIVDKDFVMLVDGNFKKLINPKKKRVKHLKHSGIKINTIAEKLLSGKKVFDTEVYSAIKNCEINK
jgi:ribosomal protein L14E/L6E/L27E